MNVNTTREIHITTKPTTKAIATLKKMLIITVKALYKFPKAKTEFADADKVASWAQEAVRAVSAAGIMNGVGDNQFDPTGVYTCEQSALCLLRTYKLLCPTSR